MRTTHQVLRGLRLTRRNLAALSTERGDHAEAIRQWREVLKECASDQEALQYLPAADTSATTVTV